MFLIEWYATVEVYTVINLIHREHEIQAKLNGTNNSFSDISPATLVISNGDQINDDDGESQVGETIIPSNLSTQSDQNIFSTNAQRNADQNTGFPTNIPPNPCQETPFPTNALPTVDQEKSFSTYVPTKSDQNDISSFANIQTLGSDQELSSQSSLVTNQHTPETGEISSVVLKDEPSTSSTAAPISTLSENDSKLIEDADVIVRVVHGIRYYVCQICHKTYNLKGNWKKHTLIHFNQKPFQCDFCLKKFSSRTSRNRHRMNHGLTSYECNVCRKEYFNKCKCNNSLTC